MHKATVCFKVAWYTRTDLVASELGIPGDQAIWFLFLWPLTTDPKLKGNI